MGYLPTIGGFGGGLIGAPTGLVSAIGGAAAGGVLGEFLKQEAGKRLGYTEGETSEEELDAMLMSGLTEGAFQGVGDLPVRAARFLSRGPLSTTKAAQVVEQAATKFDKFAPLPAAPKELTKPAIADIPSALRAQEMAPRLSLQPIQVSEPMFKKEVLAGTQRGLNNALESVRQVTVSPEITGLQTQEALRQGSAIWHRRGGELYDQAKGLLYGQQIPSTPVRNVADKLLLESQTTRLHFPESGTYSTEVSKILNDLSGLPEEVPYEVLDNYRKMLIQKLTTEDLAASQKDGILKLVTQSLTEAMDQGAQAIG
ncbi:MAG: hypothetical protein ACREBU_24880, partial [Nitrososphaera sp.]